MRCRITEEPSIGVFIFRFLPVQIVPLSLDKKHLRQCHKKRVDMVMMHENMIKYVQMGIWVCNISSYAMTSFRERECCVQGVVNLWEVISSASIVVQT